MVHKLHNFIGLPNAFKIHGISITYIPFLNLGREASSQEVKTIKEIQN
jgi:hypothetical protein